MQYSYLSQNVQQKNPKNISMTKKENKKKFTGSKFLLIILGPSTFNLSKKKK